MRMLTFLSVALLCASCAVTDVKKTDAMPAGASYAKGFAGEWTRGQPSADGHYSERLVIAKERAQMFEDGELVLSGSTVVKSDKLIIEAGMNNSRYYRKLGGCWARLRNDDMSLDLFGNVKGLLSFDRKAQNKTPEHISEGRERPSENAQR